MVRGWRVETRMWAWWRNPKNWNDALWTTPGARNGNRIGAVDKRRMSRIDAETTMLMGQVHHPLGDLTYGVKTKRRSPLQICDARTDACKPFVLFALTRETKAGSPLLYAWSVGQIVAPWLHHFRV